MENDGGIGVVGHEVDIGPEVVFGMLLGVPMELVLELVAAEIVEFGDGGACIDFVAADGGVGAAGVVEFAALAAGLFAIEGGFFETDFAIGISDVIAVSREYVPVDFPFLRAAVDPYFRAVLPCDMLAVDVAIDEFMGGHVGGGVVADEILCEPVFADGGEAPAAGVCHKIVG